MKRIVLVLVMVVLATAAFAFDFSVGPGATVAYYTSTITASITSPAASQTVVLSSVPLTFKVFADLTYLQASVGYQMMLANHIKVTQTVGGTTSTVSDADVTGSISNLSLALLGRIPIKLGSVTISPMLGVEYDINLTDKDASGNDLKAAMSPDELDNLNQFWIKGGVAADFPVTPKIYIRPEVLVGYKFLSKVENDTITSLKTFFDTASIMDLSAEFSLLVGFKF